MSPMRFAQACRPRVQPAEAFHARRVEEEPVDLVEEAVAGRAVHLPVVTQAFAAGEDLLRDHIQRRVLACLVARELLQPPEVGLRIEQPVGMIEPKGMNLSLAQPAADQLVCRFEDDLVLHAHAGQIVHVEEAPVVDLVHGGAP